MRARARGLLRRATHRCAIALVRAPEVDRFIAEVQPAYEARSYKRAEFYRVSPDDGARLEEWRLQ